MALYINKVTVEVNGVVDEEFDNVSIGSVVKHKVVTLMNKTGHAKMQPRYTLTLSRKEPVIKSPIDLESVAGGTITLDLDGEQRITYTGVYTLETGEGSIDGETEYTHPISFSAEGRVKE
jgi:hypothetical protein